MFPVCRAVTRFDVDDQSLRKKYHIEPHHEGFLTALGHSERSVRAYGAVRLAETREDGNVEAILKAMKTEPVIGVKLGMAASAAKLGAEEGFSSLRSSCGAAESLTLELLAARYLLRLGREDCLPTVLAGLKAPDDPQATWLALELVPRLHPTPVEVEDIKMAVETALRNTNPTVRNCRSNPTADGRLLGRRSTKAQGGDRDG